MLDGPGGNEALPVVKAIPTTEDFYDFERVTSSAARASSAWPSCPRSRPRAQEFALASRREFGGAGFARVDQLLKADTGELTVLEANAILGLTDMSLLPLAADAGGIAFDALVARILDLAVARAAACGPARLVRHPGSESGRIRAAADHPARHVVAAQQ